MYTERCNKNVTYVDAITVTCVQNDIIKMSHIDAITVRCIHNDVIKM